MISVLGSSLLKTYPFAYMAEVIDNLAAKNKDAQILFNYIPTQVKEAQTIYSMCNPKTQSQIFFDVFGKGLREFLAITSHCDALIGNEGGAVNMAKALNIPTFTIFSPWINKKDWSIFENGTSNVSVHLKDFKPKLYTQPEKHYKKNAYRMYKAFDPQLIKAQLDSFTKRLAV
jgi:heptosyltransferase-2